MYELQLHRIVLLAISMTLMVIPLAATETKPFPALRIMPLGDSITKGNGAKDGTGYRAKLRQKLQLDQKGSNASTDMIGHLQNGKMKDNDHEGHSGKMLVDIRGYLEDLLPAKPNVVCIHAGTNDMDKGIHLDKADILIESIIDRIFDGSPGVTVLVALIIWADKPEMQKNTDAFNKKLATIILRKQRSGKRILSVPIDITKSDLSDHKHPNDDGYTKMATAWHSAVLDAHSRGWIQAPVSVNPDDVPGMGLGY